ncbi:hypothetical protein [Cyanobium sp. FACHB-13342]|uniref:hypothetical protein n=1 Tax=Cyanobium sp. FACHB-13342 TaxID=2692793 RepID=UPI00168020AD|nr:hypothetical protein [Cyanobium sp. FACHB-13342]MBD2422977.1 hypothetical protein [Cyanobium sp. FACHB-13342]
MIDPGLDGHFLQPLLAELTALGAGAGSGGRQVLALNGPVGAGKSTLGALLLERARARGLRLAVASIDDFYLPWERRRQALAGNPFGVSRVPPGSHDVELALGCLADWRGGAALRLPRFDKTLRDGQGDRAGEVRLDVDVVLLEGWLLGCQPVGPERLAEAELECLLPEERDWLPHWDRALETYQPLWQACAQLWLLRPRTWDLPRRWRFQAEARQRRRGGAWLHPQQLDRLVRSSLCSLPPTLYQDPLIKGARGVAVLDGRRRWVG